MSEQVMVSFYMPRELKEQLDEYARDDDRSLSSLLRLIIRDWEQRRQRARALVDTEVPSQIPESIPQGT